jgi:signal peptidase I
MMRRYLLALPVCGLLVALALRQRFVLVTVDGDSMWPTLKPGDRVLVRRVRLGQLRAGQLVVIEPPGPDGQWSTPEGGPVGSRRWIIKRVAAGPGDPRPEDCLPDPVGIPEPQVPAGQLVVIGDNPSWSQDSRQWGYFPGDRLLGVVVRRIHASAPLAANGVPGQSEDRAVPGAIWDARPAGVPEAPSR